MNLKELLSILKRKKINFTWQPSLFFSCLQDTNKSTDILLELLEICKLRGGDLYKPDTRHKKRVEHPRFQYILTHNLKLHEHEKVEITYF